MHSESITMADLDRLRDRLEAENAAKREKFVIVLPPSMLVDLAKEADRVAITKVTRDAEGATHYQVVALREGVEVTAEITGFLADLRGFRFIQAPRFTLEPKRLPRTNPADHMAQLRKFTGQDWRGRK